MTPSATTTYRGTCACTAVSWSSTAAPTSLDFCHCTQCQQISGAPFIAWLAFTFPSITFRGTDFIKTTRLLISDGMDSIASRSFCSACGSTLSMQYDCYKGTRIHLAAGTLVEGTIPEGLGRAHIWVGDKAGWYEMPQDGVRRWEGFDDEFKEVLRGFEAGERREGYEVREEREVDIESFKGEEEREDDEIVIRRAEEKDREGEGEDGGESDEELRELRRRYGGGSSGSKRQEVEVDEYMYDSD